VLFRRVEHLKKIFLNNVYIISTHSYIKKIFSKTLVFSGNIEIHTLNVSLRIKHFADNSERLNIKYALYYKCVTISCRWSREYNINGVERGDYIV